MTDEIRFYHRMKEFKKMYPYSYLLQWHADNGIYAKEIDLPQLQYHPIKSPGLLNVKRLIDYEIAIIVC